MEKFLYILQEILITILEMITLFLIFLVCFSIPELIVLIVGFIGVPLLGIVIYLAIKDFKSGLWK